MKPLSIRDCAEFIAFALSRVQTTGLLLILREYAERPDDGSTAAVCSWVQNMRDGKSYGDAISGMSPRFHPAVERILIDALEHSCLDYALADLNDILRQTAPEQELLGHLTRLVNKYAGGMSTIFICGGCLMRELEHILKRAQLEQAYEIIFNQDGKQYFTQTYLGPKAVTYREPCHSLVYATLLHTLKESSAAGRPLEISTTHFAVKQSAELSFTLSNVGSTLVLTFS